MWAGEVRAHGEGGTFSISQTLGVSQKQLHIYLVAGVAGPGAGHLAGAEGALFPPDSQNSVGVMAVVAVGH